MLSVMHGKKSDDDKYVILQVQLRFTLDIYLGIGTVADWYESKRTIYRTCIKKPYTDQLTVNN